jgi:CheY-like chemotaxis protein
MLSSKGMNMLHNRKKLHFFIIDDDRASSKLLATLLELAGHEVTEATSSAAAIEKIVHHQPDCIISDFLMPELDGLELFQQIRKIENIKQPTFILVTGKIFEFDRRRAFELGVDGYLVKPIDPETFLADVMEIVEGSMVIQFWGVRGTLPVPGINTIRYGGNTNCVTLHYAKKEFFIFDAGTGIKELSNHLQKLNHFPFSAKIFISHPHYDHINALPFFAPLYVKGNEFEILGCAQNEISIEELISAQMDSVYFPITIKEFAASLSFRNLREESICIGDLHIHTILLNHPGRCLGYRVQHKNKSFCYITDNELYLENSPNYNQFEVDRLINFIKETDVLVIDTTYTDEQYQRKIGWGHSCMSRVVDVADKAKVKLLCLYHHDPDQLDNDIDLKLKEAQSLLASRQSETQCIAPHEGYTIHI